MKNSAEYAKKLNKLCTSLKKNKDIAEPVDSVTLKDAIMVLVFGCISEYAQIAKAQVAMRRLRSCFVDFNELRVSRPREIVLALGKNYPGVDIITDRLIKLLNDVFEKYNGLDMAGLQDMGKRESQAVIKELNGITPYIYSLFVMYYLDAHAFPLNEAMLEVLRKEDIVNSSSDFDDVHGFLERQIPAAKSREIFAMLRDYCDHYGAADNVAAEQEPDNTKTVKKVAAKKVTVKKTVVKKAAKKTSDADVKTTTKKTVAKKKAVKK